MTLGDPTPARVVLVTTVVGSYPQPEWLIDRERLGERLPPRVRARELWRVAEPFLEAAQDDATRLAVSDMERAGVDVVTDGEMRRESYSNRFATALDGVDLDEPGVALDRTGHENPVPKVVGPIRRTRPVEVRDVELLRSLTDRRIKITVPGPFTMTQQAQNDHYADDRSLALAYAEAVNEELRDLKAARRAPSGRGRTRSRRSTGRSRASRARRCCTRASATRTSCTTGRAAIPSSASSTSAGRRTSR
jgi:5-methyltetrahydropteroyltriglutamate--homocysteine methyltransferase